MFPDIAKYSLGTKSPPTESYWCAVDSPKLNIKTKQKHDGAYNSDGVSGKFAMRLCLGTTELVINFLG